MEATIAADPYAELYDDEEPDWAEPEEPPTWHTIEGRTYADGTVAATHTTNDNRDHGYASEYATWQQTYRSRQAFRELCGHTRVGILGCQVRVFLDGTQQFAPEEMARRDRLDELAAVMALELGAMLPEFAGATWDEVIARLQSLSPGV
jgi:hypothetical protein